MLFFKKKTDKITIIETQKWVRWKGSVIPNIIGTTLFQTVWATVVAVSILVGRLDVKDWIRFPSSIINVMAIVVGMLLVFRTNTAYSRFWEGRTLWGSLITNIRNFSRLIWIFCPEETEQDTYQKYTALRLLIAFAVAVKHHLRNEHGYVHPDFKGLLPEMHDFGPREVIKKDDVSCNVYYHCGCVNIPLAIANLLTAFVRKKREKDQIHFMMGTSMLTQIAGLVDLLGNFERILMTPIPLAYNLHLKQVLLVYTFILPILFIGDAGWFIIPLQAIIAFILFGVEAIGAEIENPFGFDEADLPLETFCEEIRRQIGIMIQSEPPVNPSQWNGRFHRASIFQTEMREVLAGDIAFTPTTAGGVAENGGSIIGMPPFVS